MASRPKESVYHGLVFCIAPEVRVLSMKSISGINNLCLLTCPIVGLLGLYHRAKFGHGVKMLPV